MGETQMYGLNVDLELELRVYRTGLMVETQVYELNIDLEFRVFIRAECNETMVQSYI